MDIQAISVLGVSVASGRRAKVLFLRVYQGISLPTVTNPPKKRVKKVTGLRYWMTRVLEECEKVCADFSADPVHDLRVSLRRCRSMADGLMAMDPDPDWKAMKKAGKRLFQRLGDLRDVQIMMEWIEKLQPRAAEKSLSDLPATSSADAGLHIESPATSDADHYASPDPAAHALLQILSRRESEQKHEARTALEEFDQKQWRQWSKSLPARASRIRPGSAVFKHLALERWTTARELHTRALRNRSQIALHTLRIGIKRFRYIVENFLPLEHQAWKDDLKEIQDLLGEVHDLDVLWTTALSCRVFPDEASRKRWHARIVEERTKRVERYRQKMTGADSLWNVWRAALPQGKQVQDLATRRMKLWARALDPDFAHSERVARLALELYDGLTSFRLLATENGSDARSSLFLAALLHDVGKSKKKKGHHKASLELIKSHGTPLGWKAEDMRRASIVARFHCGALPSRSHKALRDLLFPEQKTTIQLAAVLRLANALDAEHDGRVQRVRVGEDSKGQPGALPGCVVVGAAGYSARSATARAVAAERHLLETILQRPVMVKPLRPEARRARYRG